MQYLSYSTDTCNKFFITQNRNFYYVTNVEINGAVFPLVRASKIDHSLKFIEQARQWHSWDWLLKASKTATLLELQKNARDHCSESIPNLGPVTWDDMKIETFDPPDDDIDLQDWVDSIFFGGNNQLHQRKNEKIIEYASLDWTKREYSTGVDEKYEHVRVPGNVIVVDYDRDISFLEFGDIPPPSRIIKNPKSNRAHLWWVCDGDFFGRAIQWARDIARGLAKRLGGDREYVHLYTKNPDAKHPDGSPLWEVQNTDLVYDLKTLDSVLTKEDKRKEYKKYQEYDGKNPRLFNKLRHYAYKFPIDIAGERACIEYLYELAHELGTDDVPDAEIKKICGWIATGHRRGKWPEWTRSGLSESTYYRRKRTSVISMSSVSVDSNQDHVSCVSAITNNNINISPILSQTVTQTVTPRKCRMCDTDITDTRPQTCSPKCRKAYSRRQKKIQAPLEDADITSDFIKLIPSWERKSMIIEGNP
jgi:hypothetical protein